MTNLLRGKQFIVLGLGIEEGNYKHPFGRLLLKKLVRMSSVFTTRQKGLKKALGLPVNSSTIVEASDIIFNLDTKEYIGEKHGNKVIAIALADIFGDIERERVLFIETIVPILKNLCDEGWMIIFLTFTDKLDYSLNMRIYDSLNRPEMTCVNPYPSDPKDQLKEISKSEMCICMRFHSIILSAITKTPCAILSYSNKMDDIAHRLGMDEFLLRISPDKKKYFEKYIPLDSLRFKYIIELALSKTEDQKKLFDSNLGPLKREAELNWKCLQAGLRL